MSNKRAEFSIDDDIDISELVTTKSEKKTSDANKLKQVAELSGFVSREPKKKRVRPKSPYVIQINVKAKYGAKEIFQELGERMGVFDHTTFEEAVIALLEKKGYTDLLNDYINLK